MRRVKSNQSSVTSDQMNPTRPIALDYQEWMQAVSAASRQRVEVVPPGWYTENGLMALLGRGRTWLKMNLPGAIEHGYVERRSFKIECEGENTVRGGGKIARVWHYRVKEVPKLAPSRQGAKGGME